MLKRFGSWLPALLLADAINLHDCTCGLQGKQAEPHAKNIYIYIIDIDRYIIYIEIDISSSRILHNYSRYSTVENNLWKFNMQWTSRVWENRAFYVQVAEICWNVITETTVRLLRSATAKAWKSCTGPLQLQDMLRIASNCFTDWWSDVICHQIHFRSFHRTLPTLLSENRSHWRCHLHPWHPRWLAPHLAQWL